MVRMSINKYRLWFKRSKHSSQDLRNADIRHLPLQLFQLKSKVKGFVIIAKKWHLIPFFRLDPLLLAFVIVFDEDIQYIYYVLIHI